MRPLVFLRLTNGKRGRWVFLKDCVWNRSILRNKHVLEPTLHAYRVLFQDTLAVQNVSTDMLVEDLLKLSKSARTGNEYDYQYARDVLEEVSRAPQNSEALRKLSGQQCWPCRTSTASHQLQSIGSFYVNDRQDLFDIFSSTHTFLDFSFDASKKFVTWLRGQFRFTCLSEQVSIETESREPLVHDEQLTQDFRGRADALIKYAIVCGH